MINVALPRPVIDLTGRHIFIAGGSRGIGRMTALMAARAGASVSVCYVRDKAAADSVAAQIGDEGGTAFVVQADLTVDGDADRALDAAVEKQGPLHGLVVAAGIFEPSPIEAMTLDFWERTMSQNLRSTFLSVRGAARHLRAAGQGGSIVIYTSTAGQRGSDTYSAYATSKGAQLLFMRSMAKELAYDRIRVNCVAPGWTETDMTTATIDALGRADIVASIPLGRIGKPEDPSGAACFLLSDLAVFITGSTITVDGGFDMRG